MLLEGSHVEETNEWRVSLDFMNGNDMCGPLSFNRIIC